MMKAHHLQLKQLLSGHGETLVGVELGVSGGNLSEFPPREFPKLILFMGSLPMRCRPIGRKGRASYSFRAAAQTCFVDGIRPRGGAISARA